MNDINAAQRMRVAAAERAEANKVTVVKAAEASAEAKFLEGAHRSRSASQARQSLQNIVDDLSPKCPISERLLQIMPCFK